VAWIGILGVVMINFLLLFFAELYQMLLYIRKAVSLEGYESGLIFKGFIGSLGLT